MNSWHDRRILDLFGIDLPILQAPMGGAAGSGDLINLWSRQAASVGEIAAAELTRAPPERWRSSPPNHAQF